MLAKNTRALVATVAVALITGIMMALWVALMPAPAQAQSGDVLRLLSIEVVNHTDDEDFGPFGDRADEPYIEVNGVNVWDAGNTNDHLSDGTTRTIDVSVPISGDSVSVQVWEADGGRQSVTNPDDLIGDFPARYTDGTEKTEKLSYRNGDAVYEVRYVVDRPPNTPPEILDLSPAPGSETKELKPLISATIKDNEEDLSASNIKLFVDGNGKTFAYDKASDKLTYQSAELAEGQHMARIEATDTPGLKDFKEWSFRIVKPDPETNTPPEIVDVSPALGSKIKSRTPLISATVRDAQTDLDATAIRLFVDGSARTASYDKASDKLTYQSTKLARRQHTVRIEATDEKGLQTGKDWNFKIVRKK